MAHHPSPSAPRFRAPPDSWDTHFHVFDRDDQTAADPSAAYQPSDAPMSELNRMHKAIGIDRGVLVQSTSVMPHYDRLIRQLKDNPRLMGTAVINDATTDGELQDLDQAGVRGARFHFASFLNKRPDAGMFERAIARMKTLGWHVLIHAEAVDLIELAPQLQRLPIPVVIDHVAHMRIRDGIDQPGFRQLLELQREAHIWIKVSNCDRWSAAGAPTYADAIPFGRKLVEANADRLLWATDWPHVMYKDPRNPGDPPPDDGHLLDLFHAFVDRDDAIARQILVDNPLKLYGERPAA